MRLRFVAGLLGALALVVPAAAAAQGLGDAAARERSKREAKKDEAKVFTNEDLEKGRPAGKPKTSGSDSASAPSSSSAPPSSSPYIPEGERNTEPGSEGPPGDRSSESSSEENRRAQERQFTGELEAAHSRLAQVEGRIRELQGKLNPMSTTYIYGDLNVSGNKAAEEAQVRSQLSEAEGELTAARQDVAAATQALQDFKVGRFPSRE